MTLMGEAANYTDLRVITMEKAPRAKPGEAIHSQGSWLALSHMDWMRVESIDLDKQIPERVQLDRIVGNNRDLSSNPPGCATYSRPIYIMREFSTDDREGVEHFWEVPSAFMVITRIHSSILSQRSFEEKLEEWLRSAEDGRIQPYNHAGASGDLGERVLFLYYRTLELSDIIMITKSDSVQALLKCNGRLYTMPEAGDIYSYYCIHRRELEKDTESSVGGDTIPLVSCKFAVRSAQNCRKLLPKLRGWFSGSTPDKSEPAFFVTGLEDINIIVYDRSSRELCDIFKKILGCGGDFQLAFNDCSTCLGLKEEGLPFPKGDSGLEEAKDGVSEEYKRLCVEFVGLTERHHLDGDWVRPLRELLNGLANISDNYVLQQMSYILLNGLRGIVHRMENWSEKKYASSQKDQEIMQMITGISYLMEYISRKEEELVHHPETRPLLFDIPANLLEFYLFFSDQCTRYFQSREGFQGKNRDYYLLLIPGLCDSISIQDRLSFKDARERLLFVEIPLRMLYEPFHAICSLVHEVAHHSGEATRYRKMRFSLLVKCAAILMADQLDMGDSDLVCACISKKIRERYPKGLDEYMADIKKYLQQVTDALCQTEPFVETLWGVYLDDKKFPPVEELRELNSHMIQYRKNRGTKYTTALCMMLREVEYLFKETYADLAMLTLLELEAAEYIELLEKVSIPKDEDNKNSYFRRIERAGLVLAAIDEGTLLGLSNCAEQEDSFAGEVRQYCRVLLDETSDPEMNLPKWKGDNEGYHSLEIAEMILIYLKECVRAIQEFDTDPNNQPTLKLIRDRFCMFAKNQRFASLAFFEVIEEYRSQFIDRIHSNHAQ